MTDNNDPRGGIAAKIDEIETAKKPRTITIKVDAELYEKIEGAAKDEDRTVPVTVRRAVRAHFDK